jgi:hypothetical protein
VPSTCDSSTTDWAEEFIRILADGCSCDVTDM